MSIQAGRFNVTIRHQDQLKLQQFEDSKKFSFQIRNFLCAPVLPLRGSLKFTCNNGIHPYNTNCCSGSECKSDVLRPEYPRITQCDFTFNADSVSSKCYCVIKCDNTSAFLGNFDAFFTYSVVNKYLEISVKCRCTSNDVSLRGQEYHVSITNFPDNNTLRQDLNLGPDDAVEIVCEINFRNKKYRSKINKKRENILKNIKPPKPVSKRIKPLEAALNDDLKTLFEDQKFCDVKLITRDDREIGAHKAILAARSPVFSDMFKHDGPEQHVNLVEIKDFDYAVLNATLRYVYTGRVDGIEELATEILPVAEKYGMMILKDYCEDVLMGNLDTSNAVQILILSDMCDAYILKEAAKEFIISKGRDIVEREEYEKLKMFHPNLVMEICEIMLKK